MHSALRPVVTAACGVALSASVVLGIAGPALAAPMNGSPISPTTAPAAAPTTASPSAAASAPAAASASSSAPTATAGTATSHPTAPQSPSAPASASSASPAPSKGSSGTSPWLFFAVVLIASVGAGLFISYSRSKRS
ncbi:cytoskeletal protein RodZ [Streptacidiphilus sp. BW17]|uniref:hypothetical protein n=1 Tax=Streptacidiphilus sp. BW17 TaxID=3156274 RepID=UPI0035134CE6